MAYLNLFGVSFYFSEESLFSISFTDLSLFLITWKDWNNYESISILLLDLLNKISFSWSQFRLPLNCCCVAKSGGIRKCWHHNLSPKTKTVTILNWVIKGGSDWFHLHSMILDSSDSSSFTFWSSKFSSSSRCNWNGISNDNIQSVQLSFELLF